MFVKRVSLLLAAIVVVLVIAACGGDPAPHCGARCDGPC